jgi:hypothetical protein
MGSSNCTYSEIYFRSNLGHNLKGQYQRTDLQRKEHFKLRPRCIPKFPLLKLNSSMKRLNRENYERVKPYLKVNLSQYVPVK